MAVYCTYEQYLHLPATCLNPLPTHAISGHIPLSATELYVSIVKGV